MRGSEGHGQANGAPLLLRILRDQRVSFLLVGAFNTALGFGLFVVLDLTLGRTLDAVAGRTVGSLATLLCSYAVAIVVAFFLYRKFVFRVRGHLLRDFLRFQSVYWVALTINAFALPILVGWGFPRIPTQAAIVIVTTVISYVGHRFFSFRRAPIATSSDRTRSPSTD
jgi:putative flippase GtrA